MISRCVLVALLMLAADGLAWSQEQPANLVQNPSLEDDLAGRPLPPGWGTWMQPGHSYTAAVVPGGRTGGKSLLIHGEGEYCAVTTTRQRVVPRARYFARGWMKLEGDTTASAAVKLDYMRLDGNYIGEVRMGDVFVGQEGWQCIAIAAHADDFAGAAFVALAVSLKGKGKAWFDDLELIAEGPPEPGANLLANGNMEELAGDRPAYWYPYADPGKQVALSACEENPKEGKRSLCLKAKAPWAVGLGERYRIEPGKTYTLSGSVGVKSGKASLKVDYYRGVQFLGATEAPPVSANAWEERSVTTQFEKYPNATTFGVTAIAFGGEIEAYFDDVRLVEK